MPGPLRWVHGNGWLKIQEFCQPVCCSVIWAGNLTWWDHVPVPTGTCECYLPGLYPTPESHCAFTLYQHTTDPETTHWQSKSKSESLRMEKTRGETRGPGAPSGASQSSLYLFHKHCVVPEPAHPAAESLNSDGLEQTRSCYSPTSSPQKHSQGRLEFIGGRRSPNKRKFQASGVCQGPSLLCPRWSWRHSGISLPWAATGPWSVLPEAPALGLPPGPPDPRLEGSPGSPTPASGFQLRPTPQTGSPGMRRGGSGLLPAGMPSSCVLLLRGLMA